MAPISGAQVIARGLRDLGVTIVFGIVGIPVVEIAEEAINLGIRFIGFRNEQAAGYAASVYGYLTGRPGVCLVVGGPGVLHAMPGIGNSSVNAFPLLLLAGSSETHLVSKGAFQEMDAVCLLSPHTKLALRPPTLDDIPEAIQTAYRVSFYGHPGPSFLDLPADLIQSTTPSLLLSNSSPTSVPNPPQPSASSSMLFKISSLLKSARAPLIIIGKGAAYARAESSVRDLIERTQIPFLPTPMGKGVLPDSHPLNTASARSTALREADVVLLLGARLNWILHFGSPPKWSLSVKMIQIDICAEELGRNGADSALAVQGDLNTVIPDLIAHLGSWRYDPSVSPYSSRLLASKEKNLSLAAEKAASRQIPLTHSVALSAIERTLRTLSPPEEGKIVYVSEGANTMDVSRSIFPLSFPRQRLDAGTHATMGVGMGYAIAAHAAYNLTGEATGTPELGSKPGRKKIVCLEGDSAFGFSAMEVETMSRYGMDVLIFVINNGGIYHGDTDDASRFEELRRNTLAPFGAGEKGLRSTSLGWKTGYEKVAEMCGGVGLVASTVEEVESATRRGWAEDRVCVVNVLVGKGDGGKLEFGWQGGSRGRGEKEEGSENAKIAKL